MIWPNSANGSCVCRGWFHITNCECNSNILAYNNQGSMISDKKICWINLKNKTKLQVVLESYNPMDAVLKPRVNYFFQSSYNVVIKGNL